MNCQECREQLVAYVEGLLDESARRDVEAHLEACAACGAERDAAVRFQGRLVSDAHALGQAPLAEAVMEGILREQTFRLRRIAARRKYLRAGLAAAATLIAGTVLASLLWERDVTLADVQEAVGRESWIHIRYDLDETKLDELPTIMQNDGIVEVWISLRDGNRYTHWVNGNAEFHDWARNISHHYKKQYGYIAVQWRSSYPPGMKPPEWKPKTAWESAVGPAEQQAREPKDTKYVRVERHDDTIDGRNVLRFDRFFKDETGERLLNQLWADPKTRRPVRERLHYRTSEAERKQGKRQSVTGVYDFPQEGPSSIYDLGVPPQTKVVLIGNDIPLPKPDVRKIIAAAEKAQHDFPTSYRAVIWTNDADREIEVIHRQGEKVRRDRCVSMGPERPAQHLPLPASAEQVLEWTRKQVPALVSLFDGERLLERTGPAGADAAGKRDLPQVRVTRMAAEDFFASGGNPIVLFQWPVGPAITSYVYEVVSGGSETPAGCIALRGEKGGSRSDIYLDPSVNYICVRSVNWFKPHGEWEKTTEQWLSRFQRLPGGQWYAARRLWIDYGGPEPRRHRSQEYWNIDLKVLKADEFPAGLLDAHKLLEGVQQKPE
jgi:hypothetical protein